MPEEQDIDQQEVLNPDEATGQETETGDTNEVDVEALQNEAAKSLERKKYADRVAAENKRLKQELRDLKPDSNSAVTESSSVPDERFERLELKADGYSKDEIDQIMELGGTRALDNPLVSKAIQVARREAKSKAATPSGTAKSPVYQQFSERDLRKMSSEELEKIIPQD